MEKKLNLMIGAGSAIVGTFGFVNTFFYTVEAGERAVVFDKLKGLKENVIGEGIHFYIPFL
jgi:prohibitin 1